MSKVEDLEKEVQDLKELVTQIAAAKGIKPPQPVKVDMTYLCPKDPNREKVLAAGGVVMPEDAPVHLAGYITDIQNVPEKKFTFGPDGRRIQFEVMHRTAKWICGTDGSTIDLDPYQV